MLMWRHEIEKRTFSKLFNNSVKKKKSSQAKQK